MPGFSREITIFTCVTKEKEKGRVTGPSLLALDGEWSRGIGVFDLRELVLMEERCVVDDVDVDVTLPVDQLRLPHDELVAHVVERVDPGVSGQHHRLDVLVVVLLAVDLQSESDVVAKFHFGFLS